MILSTRYVPHMAVMILVAMVPIVVHSYLDLRSDECADPVRLAASSSWRHQKERDAFMRRRLRAHQWKEGKLPTQPGEPAIRYTIVRSYDAKRLYYRIERRLLGAEPDVQEIVEVEAGSEQLPIRTLRFHPKPGSAGATVPAYLLVYDGRPVGNPYVNQLLAAPLRMLTGRLPMTAFFAASDVHMREMDAVQKRQIEWLVESWHRYREICFP